MGALTDIMAGGRITAAMIQAVAPNAASKGANQSVTSSTTLVNDDALYVDVEANATYFVLLQAVYTGGTEGSSDLKITFTIPSGSMTWSSLRYASNGTLGIETLQGTGSGNTSDCGTSGSGNNARSVLVWGFLTTGDTAGTLQLKWAQNTSNATATTVESGSSLATWQVA